MPRPPPGSTLFPYTTLFRSRRGVAQAVAHRLEQAGGKVRRVVLLADAGRGGRGPPVTVERQAALAHGEDMTRRHAADALEERRAGIAEVHQEIVGDRGNRKSVV